MYENYSGQITSSSNAAGMGIAVPKISKEEQMLSEIGKVFLEIEARSSHFLLPNRLPQEQNEKDIEGEMLSPVGSKIKGLIWQGQQLLSRIPN